MDFDQVIERRGTCCAKWDTFDKIYHNNKLIHAGCADMDFQSPPEIAQKLTEVVNHRIFGYTDLSDEFYNGIVYWYKTRHSVVVEKEQILFSPRINIACGLCVEAFSRPGDEIVLPSPSYPPLKQAITDNGRFCIDTPMIIEQGRFKFDLSSMSKKLTDKTKMMILVNPHNPTGRVLSLEELNEIAAFCVKHHLILFVDEIHSDLLAAGVKYHSALELKGDIEQSLIVASSPAKTFNVPGAIISYLIIKNEILKKAVAVEINRIGEHNPNIFANAVMSVAYQKCAYYVDEVCSYIDGNEAYFVAELKKIFPLTEFYAREGTYLLWFDLKMHFDDYESLYDFFINKAGVEVYFGNHFGSGFSRFIRFNLACPRKILSEVLARIKKACKMP